MRRGIYNLHNIQEFNFFLLNIKLANITLLIIKKVKDEDKFPKILRVPQSKIQNHN